MQTRTEIFAKHSMGMLAIYLFTLVMASFDDLNRAEGAEGFVFTYLSHLGSSWYWGLLAAAAAGLFWRPFKR